LVQGVALGEFDANIGNEVGLDVWARNPADWQTWPAPTCAAHPNACENLDFSDVTQWLPALGLS
jgi:hypothetical protein